MYTELLTERQALASAIITTLNNTAINTGNGLNMATLKRVRAFLHLGTVAGGGSVNFSIQASATSGGSFAAITGLTTLPALTGLVLANGWYTIEISSDLLPAGKPWVRAIATETGVQNVLADLFMIGGDSDYCPVMTSTGAAAQSPNLTTITFTNAVTAAV